VTRRALYVLLGVAAALAAAVLLLRIAERSATAPGTMPLLPGFETHANAIDTIRISAGTDAEAVTLHRDGDRWEVGERDDYLADIGKLRKLVVALTEARILEEKTSDPDRYGRLGLAATPGEDAAIEVDVSGDTFSQTVFFGNSPQRDTRYVRLGDNPASYLIDRNPEIPREAGQWLLPEIVDIGAGRVHRVTIEHADSEPIVIEKDSKELTDFSVRDIPEGRELSYPTVANGIAGMLAGLNLQDVRKSRDMTPSTTVAVETWNGVRIDARIAAEGDQTWIAFAASTVPAPSSGGGDEDAAATPANERAAADEARAIEERVSGWQYRVTEQKKNLLTRHWDDILKSR